MRCQESVMSLFEKLCSFIILVAVLLGIGLGQFNWINVKAELPILAGITQLLMFLYAKE